MMLRVPDRRFRISFEAPGNAEVIRIKRGNSTRFCILLGYSVEPYLIFQPTDEIQH